MTDLLPRPAGVQVGTPTVYADQSLFLDNVEQQMVVVNDSKHDVRWLYARQVWKLPAGAEKPTFVPLKTCIKYLGDPRSAFGLTARYEIPGSADGRPGTIPERWAEMRRLSVLYGAYEDKMERLAQLRVEDLQDTNPHSPSYKVLHINNRQRKEFLVPRVTVKTLDGVEIVFPIFEPKASPYRYSTGESQLADVRTEFDRLRKVQAELESRIDSMQRGEDAEDDTPEAAVDTIEA